MLRTTVYSENNEGEAVRKSSSEDFAGDDATERGRVDRGQSPATTAEPEVRYADARLVVVARRENGRLLGEYVESLGYRVTLVASISDAKVPLAEDEAVAAVLIDGDVPGTLTNYDGAFDDAKVPILTLTGRRLPRVSLPWQGLTLEKPVTKAVLGDTVRAITSTAGS